MEIKRLMSAEVEREFIKKLIEKTEDHSAEWVWESCCEIEDKETSVKFLIYLSDDEDSVSYINRVSFGDEWTEIEIFISPTKELLDAIDFYMLENLKNKLNNGLSEACKEAVLGFGSDVSRFQWEDFYIIKRGDDYLVGDADNHFEIGLSKVIEPKSDYHIVCVYFNTLIRSFEEVTAVEIENFIKK